MADKPYSLTSPGIGVTEPVESPPDPKPRPQPKLHSTLIPWPPARPPMPALGKGLTNGRR